MSIKAVTIDDGGLFLRPIPGDMLRVAERKPQVSTSYNRKETRTPKSLPRAFSEEKASQASF